MKNKKLIIVFAVIIFIMVGLWLFFPKYSLTSSEKKRIKKEIVNNIDILTDESSTFEQFQKILGNDIVNVVVPVGKDSYLRNKPSERIISKYNLSDLVEEQDELVKKVEVRYLNNLEYEIIAEDVDGNKLCETIEIKTYYYALYLTDYINLVNSLLSFDLKDIGSNDKSIVEYYNLQLKALRVLDKHLDDYENIDNEKESIYICYKNGKLMNDSEAITLNSALQGEMYSNMNFSNKKNVKLSNERIKKYLKEAEEIV